MIQEQLQDCETSVVMEQEQVEEQCAPVNDHTALLMRFILISVSSIALFYLLGERLLRTWDESIYAEIAKESLYLHNWLTPYWNYQPWFEKPPLFMWLTALMYRLFGVSELSARMITALCGVATIWLTYELGRRLMDNWSGFAAAAILLTNGYFIFSSRMGHLDVPLTFCLTVIAYAYVRVREGEPRWWYLAGTFAGLAIMVKGAAGFLAPLSLCCALLLDRRLSELRSRETRNSAFLACAIALPWHLIMLIIHGRKFLDEYLGFHVLARVKGLDHPEPVYFYLWTYWLAFFVFALAALIGLFLHRKGKDGFSIVVSFVLVVTIVFTAVGTKLAAYCLPAFPFISLLAVSAMYRLRRVKQAAVLCAALLFSLYWLMQIQNHRFAMAYSHTPSDFGAETMTSRDEPMMQLLMQARPSDPNKSQQPMIIEIDGYTVEKQQPIFYANRPVIQASFNEPPGVSGQPRYEDVVSLERAVTDRPSPIIVRSDLYQALIISGTYDLRFIAENGPLVLAEIRRR